MATLLYFLFRMNSAASTPGTHPHIVSKQGDDDRSAALVIYGEGWEDDAGDNS